MKILFFIDELGSGGAQRQMVSLAIEFKKRGHEITFLTYRYSNFYSITLNNYGIKEVNINTKSYFKRVFLCRKFIRENNFDSVLAFLEGPSLIAELSGLPKRSWNLVVGERSANPSILTSRKQKLYRSFHHLADYIVSNSYSNLNMLFKINKNLEKDRCKVLYNIYDVELFKYNSKFVFKQQKKLKLVIASNFRYWKNLDGLIEAVNLLSKEERELIEISWYGHEFAIDDSKRKGIQKIKGYNIQHVFKFYPPSNSILDVMSKADAVGLFSLFEGLSNTICEGMALGKPIITTEVSDNSLFIKNRVNGYLCNAKSSASIANALRELIRTDSKTLYQMGKLNRKAFLKIFNLSKTCDEYLFLLKNEK